MLNNRAKSFTVLILLLTLVSNLSVQPAFSDGSVVDKTIEQQVNPGEDNKILIISQTALNNTTAKVGETFSASLAENLVSGQEILAPKGSIISGPITRVTQPKRARMYGTITVSLNQIQTPQGETISLGERPIIVEMIPPEGKRFMERVGERTPVAMAASGTSIPLNEATDLNGGVVYAISVGASAVMGAVTGFFDPDYGKTRGRTALYRAFESTPLGSVYLATTKGEKVNVSRGDTLVVTFNKETMKIVQNQAACMRQAKTDPEPVISEADK